MKQFYKNMPVLVTGGCGFIGSHLAEKLVELGAQVTIMDSLASGSLENIKNIKQSITFINKDIVNFQDCLEVAQGKKIIFHLAAFISVPESLEKPMACYQTNVQGTLNLLEAARKNNVERFIFSSSAAVYGLCEGVCSEKTPCAPTSPYGYSKYIGELYCQQYAQNFGLTCVILRYFNVYGPRQNPNGQYAAVVAKFTHAMKNNEPITIFGDGTQTRDFIEVDKVVYTNLMMGMADIQKITGNIFNVATGRSISLIELITMLKNKYPQYSGSILFKEPRPGDIKHSRADIKKLRLLKKGALIKQSPITNSSTRTIMHQEHP